MTRIIMNNPVIKRGWLRSFLYLLAMVFIFMVFGLPAYIIAALLSGKRPDALDLYDENIYILIVYQAIVLIGITGLTLFFARYIDKRNPVSLGFKKFRVKKDLVLGLALGFIIIAAGFAILYFTGHLEIDNIGPDYSFLAGSLILCILISWMEEISFRGYILNNLLDSFHPAGGLVISSFLFAVFHMFNPGMSLIPFMNLFLAGILLGIVFIYTRTIWYALSLHFSWNFFQGPVFGFRVSGLEMEGFIRHELTGDDIITGGSFGFEGSVLCSLIIILCIFALSSYYSKLPEIKKD